MSAAVSGTRVFYFVRNDNLILIGIATVSTVYSNYYYYYYQSREFVLLPEYSLSMIGCKKKNKNKREK